MHQKPTKTCITSAEFGRLYSDYNPRFTEVTYRYVRDRGIAEDLVSTVSWRSGRSGTGCRKM